MGRVGEMSELILTNLAYERTSCILLTGIIRPSGRLESGCQRKKKLSCRKETV